MRSLGAPQDSLGLKIDSYVMSSVCLNFTGSQMSVSFLFNLEDFSSPITFTNEDGQTILVTLAGECMNASLFLCKHVLICYLKF